MAIYQTNLSKTSLIPTQLGFLRAANQRGLLKTTKEQRLYNNLDRGAQGEQYVKNMLEIYGRKHWVIVENVWLDYYGVYESDLILLTSAAPYVFEVKNYDGTFEYRENRCFINENKLKENCIQQAEKALMNLQDLCTEVDRSIIAKGALLMVGEHNDVHIRSEVDGIEVKIRPQLRNYIQEIAYMEERQSQKPMDIRRVLDHFEKKETLNPFGPFKSYSPDEVLAGRRGVYCKTCGSYEVVSSRKFVRCKCGYEELRHEAILRMIHEFGVLTFEHDFMKQRDLRCFLAYQVSKVYLIDILNSHFEKVSGSKYTQYVNKKAKY